MSFTKILSSIVAKSFFGVDMNEYKIEGVPYCQNFGEFLNEIGSFSASLEHMIFGMYAYKFGLTSLTRRLKKKYKIFCGIIKEITLKQL
jgi:hypothetical protein